MVMADWEATLPSSPQLWWTAAQQVEQHDAVKTKPVHANFILCNNMSPQSRGEAPLS